MGDGINPVAAAAGCCCVTSLLILFHMIEYFVTNWTCSNVPTVNWQFLPRNITLDESASGALDSIRGRSVNVFQGSDQRDRFPGELPIGKFCKVWSWWGDKYGYVENTPQGAVLRFTATQTWTWMHSPHVVEPCDPLLPSYSVEQPNWFDGTYHEIYEKNKTSGQKTLLGTAKHQMQGIDLGASLFSGLNANLKWSIVFRGADPQQTVLGMAYQWYNHNLIMNFGASNWAVASHNSTGLPLGVRALPSHIVAYTSALYDLETGSDRRRRTHSHGRIHR